MKKSRHKPRPISDSDRAVLEQLLNQLNGVLVCTLAACEGRQNIPKAVEGALFTAARLAHDAQQVI